MKPFFYPDSTKVEKISLTLMLALVTGSFFSLFVDFRPTEGFTSLAALISLILTPAIAIGAWISPPIRVPRRSAIKNILLWLVFLPILWCGMFLLVTKGVGYTSLFLYGEPETQRATVIKKSSGSYRRRKCDHSVVMQTRSGIGAITKCVRKQLWRDLHKGDLVHVRLLRSSLGYSVREVQPL
jgi:hypothetical protein